MDSFYEVDEEADAMRGQRYDRVESYEYEMPSDFEDEEIDEELAFTAEDKAKFGAWFGQDEEEVGGDQDEDDEDFMEDDGGEDEEDEEEGEDAEAALDEDSYNAMLAAVTGRAPAARGRGQQLTRSAQQAQQQQPQQQQQVVTEAYPESEFNLNPGAASTGATNELTVESLLRGLGAAERRKLAPASRRLLEALNTSHAQGRAPEGSGKGARGAKGGDAAAGKGRQRRGSAGPLQRDAKAKGQGQKPKVPAVLAAPLPRVIQERQERKAGYQHTSEDVTKWQPMVKANREAPTLIFTPARGDVPAITTTKAVVSQHVPEGELEEEVAALLGAAGALKARGVQEAEEKLAMKHLTLPEVQARQERLAKLRSVLFYHELKAKRLKAIKSKDYHKRTAKAAGKRLPSEATLALDEEADDAAGRAADAEAEFERAKERLTLRHRNTSKWARRALKRGVEVMDAGTKSALAEQLRLGQSLRRRIEGATGDGGDGSDGDTSASDDEGEAGAGEPGGLGTAGRRKAKAAALQILNGGPSVDGAEASKKGLFSLPFMSRAIQRQQQAAKQEAERVLQELEEEEAGAGGEQGPGTRDSGDAGKKKGAGRRQFGGGGGEAAPFGFEDLGVGREAGEEGLAGGEGSDVEEDLEAKAERLRARLEAGTSGQGGAAASQAEQKGRKERSTGEKRRRPPTREEVQEMEAALEGGAAVSSMAGRVVERPAAEPATARPGHSSGAEARASAGAPAALVLAARDDLFKGEQHSQQQQQQQRRQQRQRQQPQQGGGAHDKDGFVAAASFAGPRAGYVFQAGPQGLGYYLDAKSVGQPAGQGSKGAGQGQRRGGQEPAQAPKQGGHAQGKRQRSSGRAAGEGGHGGAAVEVEDDGDEGQGGDASGAGQDGLDGAEAAPSREGMRAAPAGRPASQRELVSLAFAGDDVEAEFQKEKEEAVAGELPAVEAPSTLPGWGMWAGAQREPRWMRDAQRQAAAARAAAASGRKDARLKNVVVSEKWDKKGAKYQAAAVPYPFDSKDVYEGSIRQPLGREFNADTAFRNFVRPAVLKKTGAVIAPAKFSEGAVKAAANGATVGPRGVATVAGGMLLSAGPEKKSKASKKRLAAEAQKGSQTKAGRK